VVLAWLKRALTTHHLCYEALDLWGGAGMA
jgi:hypothetical protein